jgi:hypothetical protein
MSGTHMRFLRGAGLSPLLAVGLIVAACAFGGIYWARYPRVPDLSRAPLDEAMHFVATDDFNRMAAWHRRRYVLGLVDRMHKQSFADLVSMMTSGDPDRKRQMQNLRLLSYANQKEIASALTRLFLNKFFDLPRTQRDTYLTLYVLAEKAGTLYRAGDRPRGTPIRTVPESRSEYGSTPVQIQGRLRDILSDQPPHVVAQIDELMIEAEKKRQMLGMNR